ARLAVVEDLKILRPQIRRRPSGAVDGSHIQIHQRRIIRVRLPCEQSSADNTERKRRQFHLSPMSILSFPALTLGVVDFIHPRGETARPNRYARLFSSAASQFGCAPDYTQRR